MGILNLARTAELEIAKTSRRTGIDVSKVIRLGLSCGDYLSAKEIPSFYARKANGSQALIKSTPSHVLTWMKSASLYLKNKLGELASESRFDAAVCYHLKKAFPQHIDVLSFKHPNAPTLWVSKLSFTGQCIDKKGRVFLLDTTKLLEKGYTSDNVDMGKLAAINLSIAPEDSQEETSVMHQVHAKLSPIVRRQFYAAQLDRHIVQKITPTPQTAPVNKKD